MYQPDHVKTSPDFPIPDTMRAWVLGDPDQLTLTKKPVPVPKRAEVLVRIDAVAICATDLEIIHHGPPALIQGASPSTRISRRATNTWARWWHWGLVSTNTGSDSASPWKSTPDAASASAAAKACTPPVTITA